MIHSGKEISKDKNKLYRNGVDHVARFCEANQIVIPKIQAVPKNKWRVNACAFYRKNYIQICLEACARPCSNYDVRNWNWPGSSIDREPFGVLCHELGHHCDYWAGGLRWDYGSEYSTEVMKKSGEKPLTTYCPNSAEWFAEHFRLFVSNHALLQVLRPRTHALLRERWTPITGDDWVKEMGTNVPDRVLKSQRNKIATSSSLPKLLF